MLGKITRHVIAGRRAVIAATILITFLALYFSTNLRIIIDPGAILPQSHPFVASRTVLEDIFNERYALLVAIAPSPGTKNIAEVLAKVQRITDGLKAVPGIANSTLLSVSSRNAKAISAGGVGLNVTPLRSELAHPERLKQLLAQNPIYQQTIVSRDGRMFAVLAEFRPDKRGYAHILEEVSPIIDRERTAGVSIHVSGHIEYLGEIERYSARMIVFVPIAVMLIGLLLFNAFRSFQGFILPLATAILALVWVLGIMGACHVPLDVFNATTPILILAVAAGHAVQILKRYYEEYYTLRSSGVEALTANTEAIVLSLEKVGRYMVAAGLVAAAGFLSLIVFEIKTVQTFGIFAGLGILSALVIELTFMPALRSCLRPPEWRYAKQSNRGLWSSLIAKIAVWAITRKPLIFWSIVVLVALAGAAQLRVENSMKAYFSSWTTIRKDDAAINENFAGTQVLYIIVDSGEADGIKRPQILRGIQAIQQAMEKIPGVGKTVSIDDFLIRMGRAMAGDSNNDNELPQSREIAGQYLLLYSMSGDTADLTSFVDFEYRRANIKVYVHRDDSPFVLSIVRRAQSVAGTVLPQGSTVRFAGGVAEAAALNEVMVRDKLLNMLQISLVVFVASTLLFRSLVAGLLVLLPVVIAVIVNFGLLGWLGIPLDIPTSLISAMVIGIGADFAIYFLSRYREELGRNPDEALIKTLDSAGMASLYVATSVAVGYGVLGLSFGFRLHQWMALLIASAMFVSAFVTLSLIPVILRLTRPKFLFR
ncbi:MAG: MMPL family transporter [Alphaproteobacteria bacterium]|nr:MMPL family transporter [Alphaproteobacteria bacterium]